MLCSLERPFAMLSISSTLRNSEGRSERLAQNNSKIGGAQGGEQRKKENLILFKGVVSKRDQEKSGGRADSYSYDTSQRLRGQFVERILVVDSIDKTNSQNCEP